MLGNNNGGKPKAEQPKTKVVAANASWRTFRKQRRAVKPQPKKEDRNIEDGKIGSLLIFLSLRLPRLGGRNSSLDMRRKHV